MITIFGLKIDSTLLSGIIGVIGALVGVILGGVISYSLNVKQMKKSMVLDLQIKASKQMLNEINNFRNSISSVYYGLSNFIFYLKQYNTTLKEYKLKNSIPLEQTQDSYGEIIEDDLVRFNARQINEVFQDNMKKWEEFCASFNLFWTTYESNQVILNEFSNIYDFLLKEFDVFTSARNSIVNDYQMNVSSDILLRNFINDKMLYKIQSTWKVFEKSNFDFNSYLGDFIKELQNKYLSELFNDYKIPKREPKDKSYKVLTLENNGTIREP